MEDFLNKLKAKIASMTQEELDASWEAVKDNSPNKVYLEYFEYTPVPSWGEQPLIAKINLDFNSSQTYSPNNNSGFLF